MSVKQISRPATARKQRASTFTPPLVLYAILPGMRPRSGQRLMARTAAALEVLGISRTRSANTERLVSLIGHTAYKWHATKLHTLEEVGDNIKMTKLGAETFSAREKEGMAPRTLIDAFKAVFTTGKGNDTAQVRQHHISTVTS